MPEEQNELEMQNEEEEARLARRRRYEEMMAHTRKMKRRILVIALSLVALLIVVFGALVIAQYAGQGADGQEKEEFLFSPTYNRPFSEHEIYMSRDRKVYYCDDPSGVGVTVEVNENSSDVGAAFLYFYINVIESGDEALYNSLFRTDYFKENEPQAAFSPQMLYDILICYNSTSTDAEGNTVKSYFLEYKICDNDGSFRRDIGSDMSRAQFVSICFPKDGTAPQINQLQTIYEAEPEILEPSLTLILSVVLVPTVLILGVVVVLIVYRKKKATVS